MLAPPDCCISVALCISPATCCFDTSGARRVWVPVVYLWQESKHKRRLINTN
jgi:hypothetical protein